MTLAPAAVPLLGLVQAAAVDTVLVADAASDFERWVAVVAGIATIIIAIALVVTAVAAAAVALGVRGLVRRASNLMGRVEEHSEPILGHARSVAGNVERMSDSVRDDVERFKHTLNSAQGRIARFAGLLEVVQEEAETLFVGTASTIRGVRAGAQALDGGGAEPDAGDEGDDHEPVPLPVHPDPRI